MQGDVVEIRSKYNALLATYNYDAWGNVVFITNSSGAEITDTTHIAHINPIRYRSYYYDDDTGFYYLQSRYYDPAIGRFISADSLMVVDPQSYGTNLFAYCGNNPVNRADVSGTHWRGFIRRIVRTINQFLITIGFDTSSTAAYWLDMEDEGGGIYHAKVDCWQQYFGYCELYDTVFDIATSMVSAKFTFEYGGKSYTFWAWKGDYLNLGAGAELGIYRGDEGVVLVDKSLAMKMRLVLMYNGETIVDYAPDEKQWWITGFNSNYIGIDADDLSVLIAVWFDDSDMYCTFKEYMLEEAAWLFFDGVEVAILRH